MNTILRRLSVFVSILVGGAAFAADSPINNMASRTDVPANDRRVALVIGNSSYKSSPLANPVNDARAVSAKLRSLGFTVIQRENLTIKQIGPTLREFRSRLTPGGVALFFFAGHGLQLQGNNYLPVVDADITGEEDVSLQSLEVGKVLQLMDEGKTRLNLVFLDACRNNPYARSFRSASDGLAKVSAPSGTLISFATRPGGVAADGTGKNGLYTEQLLAAMDMTNLPIEQALKRVVSGVKAASKGRQEPWIEGSIDGDFCFGVCAINTQLASLSSQIKSARTAQDIEDELWESIRNSDNPAVFREYLNGYPSGRYITQVRVKLASLNAVGVGSSSAIDLSGTWSGNYRGAVLKFLLSQNGHNLSLNRISPPQVVGTRYAGVVVGNSAQVTFFANENPLSTLQLNIVDRSTIQLISAGCGELKGYSCPPAGTTFILSR